MRTLLDTVLDRLVVPGYSSLGLAARRSGWRDPAPDALDGRTVVVTGGSSGLGQATVAGVVALGGAAEMVVRDAERGERARREILDQVPDADVTVAVCDLSDLDDARRYADDLTARREVIGGLVHNAGLLPAERTESAQGHEMTLAVHVLVPFLLTRALAGPLAAGARPGDPSRVVFVSSGGMYTAALHTEDPEFRRGRYSGGAAYARTKRMQVVLAEMLDAELPAEVVVHAMHPGWADTPGVASSMPGFHRVVGPLLRTSAQGADTAVWLLADPAPGRTGGLFWHDRASRPTHYLPWGAETAAQREALWALCVDAEDAGTT